MTETPARTWMHPRLLALLAEAEQVGIARDVAVAVITDLIEAPEFNTAVDAEFPDEG